MPFVEHPDPAVNRALIRLTDALCSWERETGRQSVLVLRERGGFVFRAASGKAIVPDDVSDDDLIRIVAD